MWEQFGDSLPYVIAELGPSWCTTADRDANEQTLARMIDVATVAGANAIKLQLKGRRYYATRDLSARFDRSKPEWVACPFETVGEYYQAREPDERLLRGVAAYCGTRGLDWSASPWDMESVELLGRFAVPWVKVASASLTDVALLDAVRALGVHVILSTGMSELAEVDAAVERLGRLPTILYCVSTYPAPVSEIDLKVMETLRDRYGCAVGYSGHERRVGDVCFAASASGAVVIERHLTLDADAWGPDHRSSLEPAGFIELVRGCRVARRSALMGSGVKVVAASEMAARERLRRA